MVYVSIILPKELERPRKEREDEAAATKREKENIAQQIDQVKDEVAYAGATLASIASAQAKAKP